MDAIAHLKETAAHVIGIPTMDAFLPLIEKHRAEIESIECKTFQYGPAERQKLDVYFPPKEALSAGGTIPVLHFFYGGGFVGGARRLAPPYDIAYASTGAFFAKRGILTVVADYRLVPEVKFPQPFEDVRDSISWVVNNGAQITEGTGVHADFEDVFILGHSAGTIYTATLLFHPTLLPPTLRSRIRGVVLKSGVFRYPPVLAGTQHPILQLFDGDWEAVEANMPITLLNKAPDALLEGFPETIMLVSEREPEGFAASNEELREVLEKRLGRRIPCTVMTGHNHVSPHWALWSGAGEEWGEEVARWVHKKAASL